MSTSVIDFTAPSASDCADWCELVLLHVLGHVDRSEEVYARNPWGVRRASAVLQRTRALELGPIYRGLLLLPRDVSSNRRVQYEEGPALLSYSDDPYVALWFADPHSTISSQIHADIEGVSGYLDERRTPAVSHVLFHHSWRCLPTPDGDMDLGVLASTNPAFDALELEWNLRCHRPIITERPPHQSFSVRPLVEIPHPSTTELDQRFTYPLWLR